MFAARDLIDASVYWRTALFLPVLIAGVVAGHLGFVRIDPEIFRMVALFVLMALSVLLLVRALWPACSAMGLMREGEPVIPDTAFSGRDDTEPALVHPEFRPSAFASSTERCTANGPDPGQSAPQTALIRMCRRLSPRGASRYSPRLRRPVPAMDAMNPLRPEVAALEQNGITRVALPRLGDPNVIPLWFGEGDLVTEEFIRDAAKQSLDDGETFYTDPRGRQDLHGSIKRYLDALYGIDLDPDRITVPGATMLGITIAAQMALGAGDHAIIVGPAWPNIESTYRVTGAEVEYVRQREDGAGWSLDMAEVRAALRPRTRSLFINTPCNPTGWVMRPEQQAELLELCRERNILLIADEVYHRNVFDGDPAPSFLSIARDDDPVVVVNGFSKAWAMTGWRIGWVVAPSRLAETWAILAECFNTGSTVFVQRAAITALECGEAAVARLREQYARGREIVTEVLGRCPRIELVPPQGAFYAFPRVRGLRSSLDFAQGVLAEENVGIAPGYTFGPGNEEYFRLCFAQSHERLREGLERIVRYLERHDNAIESG